MVPGYQGLKQEILQPMDGDNEGNRVPGGDEAAGDQQSPARGGWPQPVSVNAGAPATPDDASVPAPFGQLFRDPTAIPFVGRGEHFTGRPPDIRLDRLIGYEESRWSPLARWVLMGSQRSTEAVPELAEMTRHLRAYCEMADILDLTVNSDRRYTLTAPPSENRIFNRHYCFYESVMYFRESVISWLDGRVLAALTLLRPAMELSLLHLYWNRVGQHDCFKKYYGWLRSHGTTGKPPFADILDVVFRTLPTKDRLPASRVGLVRETLGNTWKSLCAYNHTPSIRDSVCASAGNTASSDYVLFLTTLYTTSMLLRQLLYVYVLAHPLVLFPVDRHRKWGFGGPVGIFFDPQNHAILRAALGDKDTDALAKALERDEGTRQLLEWYEGQPDLGDEGVERTWREHLEAHPMTTVPREPGERHACFQASMRALCWSLAYIQRFGPEPKLPDEVTRELERKWREW